jgi:hypothetical protein
LQRVVGGSRAAHSRQKNRSLAGNPAINRILSLGRLVRYAPLIVVLFYRLWRRIWSSFPRSHPRYSPYELMRRNWYASSCWAWYQEKGEPCQSIPDEKI